MVEAEGVVVVQAAVVERLKIFMGDALLGALLL